jgi:segregation and condensation protein A
MNTMDDLTTRVPYQIKIPVFEGPMDLLLHLIRENRIDIYDIPIAQVTDQYLEYLALMEALDLNIAGEFIVMAATLIEIKSRLLLPPSESDQAEEEEGSDPRAELVERLLEYQKYKEAADIFREWEQDRQKQFVRGATEYDTGYELPMMLEDISSVDLLSALRRMLADVGEGEEEVTSIQRRKITVRMKMSEIWRKIKDGDGKAVIFDDFFDSPSRYDIVITFLAMLELLRLRRVKVRQRKSFGNIEIYRNPETQTADGA